MVEYTILMLSLLELSSVMPARSMTTIRSLEMLGTAINDTLRFWTVVVCDFLPTLIAGHWPSTTRGRSSETAFRGPLFGTPREDSSRFRYPRERMTDRRGASTILVKSSDRWSSRIRLLQSRGRSFGMPSPVQSIFWGRH